ncbi:hypothetical protein BU15DRAFT_69245, partial [Melanogaster broomeanus]
MGSVVPWAQPLISLTQLWAQPLVLLTHLWAQSLILPMHLWAQPLVSQINSWAHLSPTYSCHTTGPSFGWPSTTAYLQAQLTVNYGGRALQYVVLYISLVDPWATGNIGSDNEASDDCLQ